MALLWVSCASLASGCLLAMDVGIARSKSSVHHDGLLGPGRTWPGLQFELAVGLIPLPHSPLDTSS